MDKRTLAERTDDEIEAILNELEEADNRYMTAYAEIVADDTIALDDKQIAICERIGHGDHLLAPVIHDDEMGSRWCDFCGVPVLMVDKHVLWHRRVQAAVKLAAHVAAMANQRAKLAGWAITNIADIARDFYTDPDDGIRVETIDDPDDPRNDPEAAYQRFLTMADTEWAGLVRDLIHGGVLTEAEEIGFRRVAGERGAREERST